MSNTDKSPLSLASQPTLREPSPFDVLPRMSDADTADGLRHIAWELRQSPDAIALALLANMLIIIAETLEVPNV